MRIATPLRRVLTLFAALAALAALAGRADAADLRITLLGGEIHREVQLSSITRDKVSFIDGAGVAHQVDIDDVVNVSRTTEAPPPPPYGSQDVMVLLRGGDRFRGGLLPGSQDRLGLSSPLVGALGFIVDDVEEVRFLEAWSAAIEKPAFPEDLEQDVFIHRSLDSLEGTLLNFTADSVIVHCSFAPRKPIPFDRLLAIRLADAPAPKPPAGRVAVLILTDGTRFTAKSVTSDGRTLEATTLRDETIRIQLTDLVTLIQKGGRFVYLSDLEPAEKKVVPWIGEEYAWDRPRFDSSFLDRPIRAGDEAFRKGIGVISGTSLTFRLTGDYGKFTSLIALDDTAGEEGDVVFEVLVDGTPRFSSEVLRKLPPDGNPRRIPPIDITGAKELTLRVAYVDDFVMDFADWIEPMLVR